MTCIIPDPDNVVCEVVTKALAMAQEHLPYRSDPAYYGRVHNVVNGLLLAAVSIADGNLGRGKGLEACQRVALIVRSQEELVG